MKIIPASENALMVYFDEEPSPALCQTIQTLAATLRARLGDHLIDLVPSYASLLVCFDPFACDEVEVRQTIMSSSRSRPAATPSPSSKLIELPVWYGSDSGPDLAALAQQSGLTESQVIELHHQREYHVYCIGFAPGFAYLGEVDERLVMPRLATPRAQVPAGSVAIAERQTAVYPAASPGGWNLIGRCPTPLFDANRNPPVPFQVGDRVKFQPIDRDEFERLGGQL